jgi:hypothetical protein
VKTKGRYSTSAEQILHSDERAHYGCTVSFENATGDRRTRTRSGSPSLVLAALCDEALALDPTYRVVSYSSPQTIYGDLVGARADRVQRRQGNTEGVQRSAFPEAAMLAQVRRSEMLHPRLRLYDRGTKPRSAGPGS